MRNGMRCPLCRAGTDSLPCSESFPKRETWFETTAAHVSADIATEMEAHRQEDAEAARMLLLEQVHLMVRDWQNDNRVVVWVTLCLFVADTDRPSIMIRQPMHLENAVQSSGSVFPLFIALIFDSFLQFAY